MNKKKSLVPEIRFPEFEKDGEWEIPLFSDYIKLFRGSSPRPINQYRTSDLSGVNWIKIGDTKEVNNYVIEKVEERITAEGAKKSRKVNKGELILANSMSYGNTYLLDLDGYIYDGWFVLREYEKNFDKSYLLQLLNSNIIQRQYSKNAAGGIVQNISSEIVYNIYLPRPEKKEQKKIARCLSSLDELIRAQIDKHGALLDHKKGLLQNLFPQEGQKAPNYRFPEFKEAGDWKTSLFSKMFIFFVTNSFSRAKLNYESGLVKNIHYGDIHTKFSTLFDISKEEVPYINRDISLNGIKKENYCKVGDMIFADASEDLDDIGKSIEIINLNGEKLLSGLHTLLVRQLGNDLELGFGGYLFKSPHIRKQIKREAQGAKVLGISGTRLANIKLSFPENKKEQKKITSCLSAIDNLITAQTQKIEKLQAHKKGLMQKLFLTS